MYKSIKIFTGLLILGVMGCMGPVCLPEIHRYQLAWCAPMASAIHHGQKTLFVSLPQASPPYNTSKMLYSKGCNEIRSFAEHQWVSQPAQMILPLIVQAMRNTHRFKAVTGTPSVANTDYRLDTVLLLFQQEFRGKCSQVHIVLDATLIASSTQNVIATRRINICVPAACNNPVSGVAAYQCALDKMLRQLQHFLEAPTPTPLPREGEGSLELN